MKRLERYILGKMMTVWAGFTVLALSILLLERMMRVVELVSGAPDAAATAMQMLANLVPHYLSVAIGAALFLGSLITVDRLSRTGELSAMTGSGMSLFQVVRPMVLASLVLAAVSLVLTGLVQPLSRYEYRQLVNRIQQQSIQTAFQERKFVSVGDWVVWTGSVDQGGSGLGDTFMLELREDGSRRLMAAPSGSLHAEFGQPSRIELYHGSGATLPADDAPVYQLDFEALTWMLPGEVEAFRPRGSDERELTLFELYAASQGPNAWGVEPHLAATAIHVQTGRAALLLFLPLAALPLGLSYGRSPPANGIAAGLVLMLFVQKSLEYGQILAEQGVIAPWAGTWPVVAVVAFGGGALFWRSAARVSTPPMVALSVDLGKVIGRFASFLRLRQPLQGRA